MNTPTQKEIFENTLSVVKKRYQHGVLRSPSDVAAGALAVMRLFFDEEEENKDKKFLLDHLIYSFSDSYAGMLAVFDLEADAAFDLQAEGIPSEILPREVEEEIESLKHDPGHAGERAEIAGALAKEFKEFREILKSVKEDAIGASADDMKVFSEKFENMSRRYKEISRGKNLYVASQELKPEYENLLYRCEEALPKLINIKELQKSLPFLKHANHALKHVQHAIKRIRK